MNIVRVASNRLFATAQGPGRVRQTILLYELANPVTPLVVDEGNPAAEALRQKLVARLPDALRTEGDQVLRELAAAVALRPVAQKLAPDPRPSSAPEEPWPSEVDGERLLNELRALLRAYMVLPPSADVAAALWIVHTYLMEAFDHTPYLLITSPVRECGKSTLLEILQHTADRAQLTGGITAAALYRRIDRDAPTILLDELDTRLRGDGGEALRGVLNTGFHRSGRVTLCVGDNHEDRDFRTFCPKALAGIGRPWDTVTSRSIPVRLARASKEELRTVRKIRGNLIAVECEAYRRRCRRWAEDERQALAEADPLVPDELGARQADVWRPLFAIADAAGGEWPSLARSAAIELYGVAEDEGDRALLALSDVRDIFTTRGNPPAVFSATIIGELVQMEHRPWPEYRHDRPISATGLAKLLARFGVRPRAVREGTHSRDEQKRGYKLIELLPVFHKYLGPQRIEASHPSHAQGTQARAPDVTGVTDATRSGDAEFPYFGPEMSPDDALYLEDERHALMAGL